MYTSESGESARTSDFYAYWHFVDNSQGLFFKQQTYVDRK